MIVLVLDKPSERLRGVLTRWLLEPKPGVFVGKVSAKVRELLWDKVCEDIKMNGALLIYSFPNEQGYFIEMHGDLKRSVVDIEGIQLIKVE